MYPEIASSYSAVTTDEAREIFLPTLALICFEVFLALVFVSAYNSWPNFRWTTPVSE